MFARTLFSRPPHSRSQSSRDDSPAVIDRPETDAAATENMTGLESAMTGDLETEFSIVEMAGCVVVKLRGPLDRTNAPELLPAIEPICRRAGCVLAVDLEDVPSIDPDGFGLLIRLQKRLANARGSLGLIGCQETVRQELSLTRLEILLPVFGTLTEFRRTHAAAAAKR